MTQNIKSIIIGTLGILIFGIGAGLRFQAKDLSTFEVNFDMAGVPLKDKPDYNGQKYRAVDSNKQDSITDISLVLIWTGGALVVLSLAVWLLSRKPNSAIGAMVAGPD